MSPRKTTAARPVKKKSAQARKNEGNDLFFRILKNILTTKSGELYDEHLYDPTFDDVYTNVGVEKALMKCYDLKVVKGLVKLQMYYSRITDKQQHYWYLLKKIPKTNMFIDWKNGI
jgi:hypothetical protein